MTDYNVLEFGAKKDGETNNTEFIQNAIDKCNELGGGLVNIPAGDYLTGTLEMKSNVELHLDAGATLYCSSHKDNIKDGVFIKAEEAQNIFITGNGTIDGQGHKFMSENDKNGEAQLIPDSFRPNLLIFSGCKNIKISDVTFKRAAKWGLHLSGCDTAYISGVTILNSLRGSNTDGIDPDSSKNIHISNCHIEAGDDCIVLKSTKESAAKYGSCENITVTNCTLISRSSAIKIGTETNADIRDCVFNNCVIRNSNRGLGIWVRDNSIIENIIFSNMVIETRLFEGNWWGKGEPIYITAEKRIKNRKPGKIRNIKFKDIIARSESGIYLGGSEESILENITLEDIDLFIEKKSDLAGGKFDIRPVYEKKGIFESDISGIYSKYINELSLRNIKVKWDENDKQDYWSHAVYCDNIDDLELKGLKGKAAFDNLASVEMKKVKNI